MPINSIKEKIQSLITKYSQVITLQDDEIKKAEIHLKFLIGPEAGNLKYALDLGKKEKEILIEVIKDLNQILRHQPDE